jgi:DNA-binding NtrC family response regulator
MTNILVVDDEIGIRELLSEILSDEGYSIATADNAAAARRVLAAESFDLILLDIWMPDTDGVTLLKEWASKKQLSCPVIMMSGHATIETAVEATKYGALEFLEKPISMQKLLEAVHHGLEVHRRKELFAKYLPSDERPAPPPPIQPAPVPLPSFAVPGTDFVIDFNLPLKDVRETTEKAYLTAIMNHENCQMTRVAKRAGLERTHLYRKLKALAMEIPRSEKSREDEAAPEKTDAAQESVA